jgi:nuclear pore complex protein Nup93
LARLILNYTAKFESTDASDAINYYYFLRTFKSSSGDNLLETSISRLLTASKEYDLLLGSIDADGRHTAGLIDRFGIDSRRIISHVAALCEQNGDKLIAVKLYDLANVCCY